VHGAGDELVAAGDGGVLVGRLAYLAVAVDGEEAALPTDKEGASLFLPGVLESSDRGSPVATDKAGAVNCQQEPAKCSHA
jgi:hypothetical protein